MNSRFQLNSNFWDDYKKNPYFQHDIGYKYTSAEVAKLMLEKGSIKLGSLGEYKSIENAKLVDKTEGCTVTMIDSAVQFHDTPPKSGLRDLFNIGENVNLGVSNFSIHKIFEFPVFCYSYENTRKVFDSLNDPEQPHEACIKIRSVSSLAKIICSKFENQPDSVKFVNLPVKYTEKNKSPLENLPPNLVSCYEKPINFADNLEGRVTIVVNNCMDESYFVYGQKKTSSLILEIPETRYLFERVNMPEM